MQAVPRSSGPIGIASLITLGVLPFIANTGSAQDDLELFDDDVPIVLSASRLIQPISSSPSSVTIIDAQMIKQSGARTIVDILHLVPGFQVGRLVNGDPVATYNGLSERFNPRLQLIIDGRPTYVPLYGGIPWSELPVALTDIERVEVTRGPNAATFGPNSFSAVVSIITRAPAVSSGWSINSEAGGNDFRSGTLSYHGAGKNTHYRVTLQSERDEGFENIPDKERSQLASVRTHWQINPVDRLAVDVGGIRGGHVELDTVVEENDLVGYTDTTNAYTQLVWERSRAVDDSFKLQYYFNYFDIADFETTTFDLDAVTGNPDFAGLTIDAMIDRNSRSMRHEIEAQRTRRIGSRHRMVYGGAIRQDSVQSRYIFGDERKRFIYSQRIFAHSEYSAGRFWLINSGLLLENNTLSNVSASPRFSVTRRVAPGKQYRLGYSRGIRTPLLLEEEGDVAFNYQVSNGLELTDRFIVDEEEVKSEYIDVVDFGYYYKHPRQNLTLDGKLSYHRIRHLVGTQRIEQVEGDTFDQEARKYRNRYNYRFSTLELQLDWKFKRQHRIRASYTYAFGEDRRLIERKLTPRHTLSLFGSIGLGNEFSVSGEYYYTSRWIWDDVRAESRLNRIDLRLAKRVRAAKMDATFAIQAELYAGENLDYLARNQVDSAYFARVSVQLP